MYCRYYTGWGGMLAMFAEVRVERKREGGRCCTRWPRPSSGSGCTVKPPSHFKWKNKLITWKYDNVLRFGSCRTFSLAEDVTSPHPPPPLPSHFPYSSLPLHSSSPLLRSANAHYFSQGALPFSPGARTFAAERPGRFASKPTSFA